MMRSFLGKGALMGMGSDATGWFSGATGTALKLISECDESVAAHEARGFIADLNQLYNEEGPHGLFTCVQNSSHNGEDLDQKRANFIHHYDYTKNVEHLPEYAGDALVPVVHKLRSLTLVYFHAVMAVVAHNRDIQRDMHAPFDLIRSFFDKYRGPHVDAPKKVSAPDVIDSRVPLRPIAISDPPVLTLLSLEKT